ncbi:MarR family winged helix-turn-helix transcriptional regulator [Cellulomonas sp. SG140]|uniref:MarR family winged helix-turn-helix transcriptional regulator n=1 Tax=Cellulomonas sp. SG140 TaxID=2976536 RepID=UPI0021E772FF|nr:MarR family transcriptional regulator [Cellulomonas sp. SG140]
MPDEPLPEPTDAPPAAQPGVPPAPRPGPRADEAPEIAQGFHDPRVVDRSGRLVQTAGMDEAELAQIVRVMDALFRWRTAEQRASAASRRYMQLGETDMKALRFVIVRTGQGHHVTARDIAAHLGISSASTTKLLDRLEAGGHIHRTAHPTDRRAIAVVVTPETRKAAEETVGREHARRFRVAAALSPQERETVIRFLDDLSATSEESWDGQAAAAASTASDGAV